MDEDWSEADIAEMAQSARHRGYKAFQCAGGGWYAAMEDDEGFHRAPPSCWTGFHASAEEALAEAWIEHG